MRILVWFREDLRIIDHPALNQAGADGDVIAGYVRKGKPVNAKDFYLERHLQSLTEKLRSEGVHMLVSDASVMDSITSWCETYAIDAVYYNKRYLADAEGEEVALNERLRAMGVDVKAFHGDVLVEPGKVLTGKGEPFKVFTPFYRQLLKKEMLQTYSQPESYQGIDAQVSFEPAEEPQWFKKLMVESPVGESAALNQMEEFLENLMKGYKEKRDFPASDHTSRLSKYFAVGALSPRVFYQEIKRVADEANGRLDTDAESLIRQLCWRDFSYQQLHAHPQAEEKAMRPEFDRFKWEDSSEHLKAWKTGQTGYPLVDAGMRELYETGFMHNRVRMIVASFLIKHLLVDWRKGKRYFQETLLDHDRANNTLGWQWVMGSGFDASPYFRIFNPITQAEKFDPKGVYIRKWVPELKALEGKAIFRPFEQTEEKLKEAGIILGETYPKPIVDHKAARERALDRYQDIKETK